MRDPGPPDPNAPAMLLDAGWTVRRLVGGDGDEVWLVCRPDFPFHWELHSEVGRYYNTWTYGEAGTRERVQMGDAFWARRDASARWAPEYAGLEAETAKDSLYDVTEDR